MKRHGYLGFYGLWDWYESQPKKVQNFLYKSCGYGINTDSKNLFEGSHEVYSSDLDDIYKTRLDTATRFLCQHAMNAVHDKEHHIANVLLEAAFKHAKSKEDSLYYLHYFQAARDKIEFIPNQAEIDEQSPAVLKLICENPGILQSEVKNKFSPELGNIIGLTMWALNKSGKIRRKKKGRSFQLWVKE